MIYFLLIVSSRQLTDISTFFVHCRKCLGSLCFKGPRQAASFLFEFVFMLQNCMNQGDRWRI